MEAMPTEAMPTEVATYGSASLNVPQASVSTSQHLSVCRPSEASPLPARRGTPKNPRARRRAGGAAPA
jgi:hypothetical protein